MTILQLDSNQLRGFAQTLGDEAEVVRTGSLKVLARYGRLCGAGAALAALARALFRQGPEDRALVQGNLMRKAIRLPAVFGRPAVRAIYGWVKTAQAMLLRDALQAQLAAHPPQAVVIFNGSNYPESVLAAVSEGLPRVFVEGGFFPGTLQVDPIGLNGANSVPRTAAFYLEGRDDAGAGLPELVNNRAAKQTYDTVDLAPGFVFVPFQVPSDMQVTQHSPWVRDMEMFLDVVIAAADANPDDTFVIKEHPSFKRSVKGLRPAHPRVIFANGNVTSEMLAQARAVVTLNSTVGIEGLVHETPVITLGAACYNIDGLVQHAPNAEALNTALRNRDWRPDAALRRQFLGYLWNVYLLRGTYDAPPDSLAARILSRAGQSMIS